MVQTYIMFDMKSDFTTKYPPPFLQMRVINTRQFH